MARDVRFTAKVGSIPITAEMRSDIDAISADTGKSLDALVRIGLTKVIKRYNQIKQRRMEKLRALVRDGGARS